MHQYQNAALAFEHSLEFRDSATIHRWLARLYRYELKEPTLASEHLTQARLASGRLSGATPLQPSSGFPRKTIPLLFDWLTKR